MVWKATLVTPYSDLRNKISTKNGGGCRDVVSAGMRELRRLVGTTWEQNVLRLHRISPYENPHEISQQKGLIEPFTASIKPVDESLRNFNTNSIFLQPSVDLWPSVDFTSTVFLRFCVVP